MTEKKRIVFAGTPEFAAESLQALLDPTLSSKYTVVAVYTQPDRPAGRGQSLKPSPVKTLALKYTLPVYQPARLKSPEEQDILRDLRPDYLIVAAYGLILPKAVLEIPTFGCINIHASLLPRWRGASPIQHAILSADKKTGITIMQMDEGLDTGDILTLYPCDIYPEDSSEVLHDRLGKLGAKAIVETLEKIEKKEIVPQKQDSSLASYATKISKEDALIDWQDSAVVIDCKIRAFNPWPVAFTFLQDDVKKDTQENFPKNSQNHLQDHPQTQTIRIWKAELCKTNESSTNTLANTETVAKTVTDRISTPGTIIASNKEGIIVATGSGMLRLLEIQLPGGKRLPVSEILKSKGALFEPGKLLV